MFHVKQSTHIMPYLAESLADCSEITEEHRRLFAAHWEMVLLWNARINLTAIHDSETAAWQHYRDSLAAWPLLSDGPVVDFGSGAGYPGIPLAIVCPQWQFTLVEPRRKRASFLQVAVARLKLANVQVINQRLEDGPDKLYMHAVTRATFSRPATLQGVARWLKPSATFLAYRQAEEASAQGSKHLYTLRGVTRFIEIFTFADD